MSLPKTVEDKLKEGRTYRDIDVSQIETREADDEGNGQKLVEGYATTFNTKYLLYSWQDYEIWEQVDRNAFNDCDTADVIMQYDHQGRVFARTGNGTLTLSTDDTGLKVLANLGGTEIGRQLFEEIKGGYTNKMSFGFKVAEDKREIVEDREHNKTIVTRTITKISKLYDVSAVSLPANDATSISARSFGAGVVDELVQELRKRDEQKKRIRILSMM